MSETQKRILLIVSLVLVILMIGLTIMAKSSNRAPKNNLTHHTYVIKGVGEFIPSYIELIKKDYGDQQFELSAGAKGNNLYLYTVGHSTTKYQEEQFGKWLVSFYGAEKK